MSAAAPKFYLRPDQEEAVEAIVAALQTDDRTQAIMACGTGKTFTGQRAAERLTKGNHDALILVAVPNMVLVDQLMREWISQADEGFDFQAQPVVSEPNSPAARAAAARRDETVTGFDLRNNTTDPDQLAAFMLGAGRRIIFSTYQSSDRIAEAVAIAKLTRPGFAIDLIVADEAHRTAGPGTKAEAGLFKTILDDAKIDAIKRLFMTATPRQSRVSTGEKDNAAFSMGNPEVYGSRAITRSLSWAVQSGHLAPYRAFIAQISDADVDGILRADPTLRVSGSDAVVTARATQIAAAIVLVKAAKQRNLGSIVTYHNSIAGARDFQTILEHVAASMPTNEKPSGSLTISHINGSTQPEDREAYLGTLDSADRKPGDWAVVTNCNCLTEGVNVPSMDAIMLVDPRSSTVGIVQAVGRPMRKDRSRPDKVASILLPVFVGEHETTAAAIESGAFATVYDALQALKDVDDTLPELFISDQAEREHGIESAPASRPSGPVGQLRVAPMADEGDGADLDPHLAVERPANAEAEGIYASVPLLRIADHDGKPLAGQPSDAILTIMAPISHGAAKSISAAHHNQWHRAISLRILNDACTPWERGLASLRSYVQQTGDARVQKLYVTSSGHKLGLWVNRVREAFRSNKLSAENQRELEAFPGWAWDAREADRLESLSSLRTYIQETGHSRVPQEYVSPTGHKLGLWVSAQRAAYNAGKLSVVDQRELESFPGWVWDTKVADRLVWLSSLRDYVRETGNARVPQQHVSPTGHKLGHWVVRQRTAFKTGKLSAEEQHELEAFPGWVWDILGADRLVWLSCLRDYVQETGDARVQRPYVSPTGHKLGAWVSAQRTAFNAGKLSAEEQRELESFPGWVWDLIEADRLESLSSLRTYVQETGHARVRQQYVSPSGHKLGLWVSRMREAYRSGKLSAEQQRELEALPGWVWDTREADRLEVLSQCRLFRAQHGNLKVPQWHVAPNGMHLGRHLHKRRTATRSGSLPASYLAELDAIDPGWRNGALAPWEIAPGIARQEETLAA